jgi:hypothetical protein
MLAERFLELKGGSLPNRDWTILKSPVKKCDKTLWGIAQLVERLVRNEKVRGSNPLTSTIFC